MTATQPAITDASYFMNPDEASALVGYLRAVNIHDVRTEQPAGGGLTYVTLGPTAYAHLASLDEHHDGHIDSTGFMWVDGLDYEWHACNAWTR